MALWGAYGVPQVPPFPKEILSLVTPVILPPTLDEIPPPDTPVANIDPILAKDASNLVQQDPSCLPTLP